MATKSQEILLKGNTTNASAVPSSLKVREIAINALDRSLFTNDGNSIVKLYTGTTKWFDVNGNANNALKLGGILASEYINKEAFNSHINNSTIHITAEERTAWNNKWDYNEETIKEVKVNAAVLSDKATKLATARKIWGRTFDGSANVSGDLEGVDNIFASGKATIQGDIISGGEVAAIVGEGTPAGVTDYSALTGKPSINGVTLVSGNNTLASLGIQPAGDYITESLVNTKLDNYTTKTFVANNYAGKAAFNNHTADTDIHITSAERKAWNAKWTYNEATIKAVKVTSASSADSVAWANITNKPSTFTPSAHTHTASDVSGLPTSLKNPYALTFGSKSYDGSAAATITASDLGALTAHQSIYAFTLQVNGTSKGTYNPTSAAKTINIAVPTKTSQITNDSSFITSAAIPTALKNPFAIEIKANGVSLGTYDGSKAATFNLSAANVGAANKIHTHTASEVSGLPTKLSAFTNDVGYITGITKSMVEGVLTGDITSHTHNYLPVSGGTIKGSIKARSYIFDDDNDNRLGQFVANDSANDTVYYVDKLWTYNVLIHSGNYNSYAPTLTGTGASGTWGISITGNAATATNADTLDGVHISSVVHFQDTTDADTVINGAAQYLGVDINAYHIPFRGGELLSFGNEWYSAQLYISHFSNRVAVRGMNYGTWSNWHELAFLDSNVASATKLQTPRTIWGHSFDGNGNVDGGITIRRFFDVANYTEGIRIVGTSNQWCGIFLGTEDSYDGYQDSQWNIFKTNIDTLRITRGTSDFSFLEIKSNGNVLIGTTTDNGYKLQVNGSERVYGDLIVDGEVSALVA